MFSGYNRAATGQLTHELTVFVTECTKPKQSQAKANPRKDTGSWAQSPSLAEGLLAVDS